MIGKESARARIALRASTTAIVVVSLVLVWRIVASGSAAWLAGDAGTDSRRTGAPAAIDAPDATWRTRLARNPADHAALVMLALELERQGRMPDAADAIRAAMRLAPSDERMLLEAAGFHLRTGAEGRGLAILRQAVELNPRVATVVWPVYAAALAGGRHDAFFAAAARDNPGWWPAFFDHACNAATDFGGVERAFAVRAASGVATAAERKCVIERQERDGRWPVAYQSWVNSLPREQQRRIGYVFNGDFENPITNVGFDWIVAGQDGVNVETQAIPGAGGRRALRIEFVRKRWTAVPVQQFLMLVPGRYRFEGRGRADGLDTWIGVQWGLHCLKQDGTAGRHLATSDRFRGTSEWADFHADLLVPADCPVQVLRFELGNPRQDVATSADVVARLNGSVWFDDFRVRSLD